MNEKFPELLEFNVNGVSFKMVRVDGLENAPLPFYIGQTLVTQALWKALMPDNPSRFKGDDLPVERIWHSDCKAFIEKLNKITGKKFRLPTEEEWEFAAKGGLKSHGYRFSGGNALAFVAWCRANSLCRTHPVALRNPNELGIYDMTGNVCEWCDNLTCRGGSCLNNIETSLITYKFGAYDAYWQLTGLRLALSPEESA